MADAIADGDGGGVRERRIRSFVLRQGRITPAQQRAFDEHWRRYGLAVDGHPRDFAALFGRRAPLVLEIGFGNGGQLLHSAEMQKDTDFIGIEVHRPGVGRLINGLAERGLGNVRVFNHDAVEVLRSEIAEAGLDEVRLYFPDPWHKKRHHKRRLFQADFLDLLASRVRRGGRLHLATDWADYAGQMQAVLADSSAWRVDPRHAVPGERPAWRIETHFERRGLRLGHGVWDFVHERI
jgi:tRNA (guanine-N7-)-methyltransferase